MQTNQIVRAYGFCVGRPAVSGSGLCLSPAYTELPHCRRRTAPRLPPARFSASDPFRRYHGISRPAPARRWFRGRRDRDRGRCRIRGTPGSAASSSGLKSPVSFDCASSSSFSVPSVSALPFSSNSFSSLADAASSPAATNTFPPDAKRADPASLPGPLISLSCMEYTRSRAMTATQSTAAPVRTYCSRSNTLFRLLFLFFFMFSYRL